MTPTITALLICMMLNANGITAVRVEPYPNYAQCLQAKEEAEVEPVPGDVPPDTTFHFHCLSIGEKTT